MHFGADMMRDETNDALAIGGAQCFTAVLDPLAEAVDPQPTVGIEHDFDDLAVGEPIRDRTAHRGAQHARAAVTCLQPDWFCAHREPRFMSLGDDARLDGDE